jgi:phage terminase small subunit
MAGLSPKQQRFVEEYLIDLNATAAAARAGYKDSSKGRQLVTKSHVSEAIAAAKEKRSLRTQITADRVLLELARVGFSDPRRLYGANGELIPIKELDDDTAAAVASVEVSEEFEGQGSARRSIGFTKKLKCWNKVEALKELAQHLGLTDKTKGIGTGSVRVRFIAEIVDTACGPAEIRIADCGPALEAPPPAIGFHPE